MALFEPTHMTVKGRNLLAKALLGEQLLFTKIQAGAGMHAEDRDYLDGLAEPKLDGELIRKTLLGGGGCSVECYLSNEGLTETFKLMEVGLFAQDPDEGEILYCYTTVKNPDLADFMAADNGSGLLEEVFTLDTYVSNAENVTVVVSKYIPEGMFVTPDDLSAHNTDPNAHSNLSRKRYAIVSDTTPDEPHELWLKPAGTVPVPGGVARLLKALRLNGETGIYEQEMYSNDARNIFLNINTGETVAEAVNTLKGIVEIGAGGRGFAVINNDFDAWGSQPGCRRETADGEDGAIIETITVMADDSLLAERATTFPDENTIVETLTFYPRVFVISNYTVETTLLTMARTTVFDGDRVIETTEGTYAEASGGEPGGSGIIDGGEF